MRGYRLTLVWGLRIAAVVRFIAMAPYFLGTLTGVQTQPVGMNWLAALELISTPLLLIAAAEILSLLMREKHAS
jgi:hypothetical protein